MWYVTFICWHLKFQSPFVNLLICHHSWVLYFLTVWSYLAAARGIYLAFKTKNKNKSCSRPEIWRQQIEEKWFCIVSTGFLGLLVLGEFSCWFLHLKCFSMSSAEFSPVTTLMIHKIGGPISKCGLLYLILNLLRGDFLYLIEWTVLGFLV